MSKLNTSTSRRFLSDDATLGFNRSERLRPFGMRVIGIPRAGGSVKGKFAALVASGDP